MKKTPASAPQSARPTGAASRVAQLLLDGGPATAADLAKRLDMTPAGVRRHLDALEALGFVSAGLRAPYGPTPERGRGRPAKVYALTESGRDTFDQAYDDLAVSALRYLNEQFGNEAVQAFAKQRGEEMRRAFGPIVEAAQASTSAERADVLAAALTEEGFAASATPGPAGIQLCQHNCPVAHVAEEFPQLCEAETAVFSELLGTHVMRLATLAHGDGVCTTHVPHLSNEERTTA